mmetsp:Transcript_10198/g.30648  ORF Transcript_10198/g.30648 Transcript_10198/m.30648 type:complete len:465 (+) Transcript_10198:63-1457(+)
MIDYEEDYVWKTLLRYEGSVALSAALYGFVSSVLCGVIHIFHGEVQLFLKETGLEEITSSQIWAALTAVLTALLAFRTTQALARFWEGTSLLHQMRGEWFDSVSCLVSFSMGSKKTTEVKIFRQTLVRLMSLCHGSALEEIADTDSLTAIDVFGLDSATLRHLKTFKQDYGFNRVECLLHTMRQLATQAFHDKVVVIDAPILTRVYQTLARGFVNLLNAKKIVDTNFPFPYAQLIATLLWVNLILTPLIMASLMRGSWVFACLFTFVPIFGSFSLNAAAGQLENPFGNDDNDLPLEHFQAEMNSSLLMLLHDRTDHVSHLSPLCVTAWEALVQTGATQRRHSICSMDSVGTAASRVSLRLELEAAVAAAEEYAQAESSPKAEASRIEDMMISLEELEPKIETLSKEVEEFSLSLPNWTQTIETQILEIGRNFSSLSDLAQFDQDEEPGGLDGEAVISLRCFPAL